MKTLTQLNEQAIPSLTSDVNPGNSDKLGVTNHLTPLNNIITNIRNLFGSYLGIVVGPGEDTVSIKLHSSKFVSKETVYDALYRTMYRSSTLYNYIVSQGLPICKLINVGQYYVVYFCPNDIKTSEEPNPESGCTKSEISDKCIGDPNCPCKEQMFDEVELESLIKESEDDEEMQDLTKKKIQEIIVSKDKVKAAKQLELIITQEIELPREYYFAGVKAKDGDESIALRWKYTKKRPHNKTSESVRSLINIFGTGKDAVWVGDFDEKSMFKLPEEVEKLIKNILDILGAEETDDKCVYSISEEDKKEDKEDKKEDKKENTNKEDKKENDDKNTGSSEEDDLLG